MPVLKYRPFFNETASSKDCFNRENSFEYRIYTSLLIRGVTLSVRYTNEEISISKGKVQYIFHEIYLSFIKPYEFAFLSG